MYSGKMGYFRVSRDLFDDVKYHLPSYRHEISLGDLIDSRIGGGIGNAINNGFPSVLRYSVYYTSCPMQGDDELRGC